MTNAARRSIWAWGLESDEPSQQERVGFAKSLSEQWGRDLPVPEAVPLSEVELRGPRIEPSEKLRPSRPLVAMPCTREAASMVAMPSIAGLPMSLTIPISKRSPEARKRAMSPPLLT